ncbi:hypothetical protein CPB85DRAFT_1408297 [Mucidula mucida]|nr:hypothetical protein CPB85DRAFT_1408297 [Mucidula mucida]
MSHLIYRSRGVLSHLPSLFQRSSYPSAISIRTMSGSASSPYAHLSVNADRLNATLHETCEFGNAHRFGSGPMDTGMARLSLDDADAQVRRWFVAEMTRLKCKVVVDQMGNIFATRGGKNASAPPTAMGSHLDTQPTGGRYDGILGVMAAVEAVRTLDENNIETQYPVAVVNWTNEEGARFPKSLIASHIWAGLSPLESGWTLQDVANPKLTMKSELERIDFLGDLECSYKVNPLAAHFELHIEQGPMLEEQNVKVGVVQGGQAYKWFTLDIEGSAAHTGTTPFYARSDALLLAARIMIANNALAKKHNGLASTGILTLQPGSVNVFPSNVRMTVDVRHPSDEVLDALEKDIKIEAERLAREESEKGCQLKWTTDFVSPKVTFAPACIESVRAAALATVGQDAVMDMYSGAGHDSCSTSAVCPTSMIFVPSKDGVSHNPKEYTSPAECATGAQVLLHAVLNYDAQRTQ